jgi:drug/metabolite transporter (DMT)-like permease
MLRNLFGLLPLFAILHWQGISPWRFKVLSFPRWPIAVVRGILAAFAQFLFFYALTKMELATARTLSYIGPIFTTLLAAFFLKDSVGIWRWSAVGIGFIGVLMVLNPSGENLNYHSLLPIGSAAFMAISFILMRLFDKSTSHAAINLLATLTALFASIILLLITQEVYWPQTPWHWFVTALSGLFGGIGVFCVSWSYRATSPVKLAPFQYLSLIYALFFGWLLFDELPLDSIFPGFIFIAGAGFIIVWRESVRKRKNTTRLTSTGD